MAKRLGEDEEPRPGSWNSFEDKLEILKGWAWVQAKEAQRAGHPVDEAEWLVLHALVGGLELGK